MSTPKPESPAVHVALRYLYRDAGNYKQQGRVVVRATDLAGAGAAPLSDSDLRAAEQAIRAACDSGEFFLPEQIGLPTLHFEGARTGDDHDFHEILGLDLCVHGADGPLGAGCVASSTSDSDTPAPATLAELVAAFQAAARSGWRLRSWH